jgi:histidinol-phosphatase (PHP family)
MNHETMLYETHSHTPLCKHAVGLPHEYAEVAYRRGLHGLIVTCHNPMPADFSPRVRMGMEDFDDYLRMVFQARQDWRGRIDVRLGIEADYFPGYERWVEHQLQLADFQYVLGALHPQLAEFKDRYWTGDALAFQRVYFRLLADAAETRLFDCLAHPDLVKNETPDDWHPELILDDVRAALDRIAKAGVAMELNTSGLNKTIPEMNPFPQMLVEMRQRSIPIVIGSDAHQPERVADRFLVALDLLQTCGYEHVSFYVNRTRRDIPIPTARRAFQPRKPMPALPNDWYLEQPTPTSPTVVV